MTGVQTCALPISILAFSYDIFISLLLFIIDSSSVDSGLDRLARASLFASSEFLYVLKNVSVCALHQLYVPIDPWIVPLCPFHEASHPVRSS